MALGSAWKQMSWLYYQYLLVTALYMLEPWERTVFSILLPVGPGGRGCVRGRGCPEAAGRGGCGGSAGPARCSGGSRAMVVLRAGPAGLEETRAGRGAGPGRSSRRSGISTRDRGLTPPRWQLLTPPH